ncbi:hypothetical protein B0H13DRAFT_2565999 [Mycena leptocephala]|nr:hypothetical protein B0H13DRAFT_2565999 [Mycena leptocephala]
MSWDCKAPPLCNSQFGRAMAFAEWTRNNLVSVRGGRITMQHMAQNVEAEFQCMANSSNSGARHTPHPTRHRGVRNGTTGAGRGPFKRSKDRRRCALATRGRKGGESISCGHGKSSGLGYLERARKKSSTTVTYRNMSETADQTNSLARIRGRKFEWRCRMKKAQFGSRVVVRKMVQGDLRTGIPARATRHATSSREERDKLQATRSGHSMITRTVCCYWRRERQGETGGNWSVVLGMEDPRCVFVVPSTAFKIAKNEITSGAELVDDDQEEDNNHQATGTILDDLC